MKSTPNIESVQSTVTLQSLFNLSGKVAIVTGGAGWLGYAISEALAELGATVILAGRKADSLTEAARKITSNFGDSMIVAEELDVRSPRLVSQCFDSVLNKFGKLDILVNNAYSGKLSSLESSDEDAWQEAIDIGLSGYYRCLKEAVIHMKKASSGSIVNIASMYGMVSPDPSIYGETNLLTPPAYGSAKAGVLQLTRYTACQLAPSGIRVNAISPGPFPSPRVQEHSEFVQQLKNKNPMGRIGQPWELKGAIAFLASAASSFVTGQNIVVDGGWTAW